MTLLLYFAPPNYIPWCVTKKKLGYLGVRIKSPLPPTNRWNFWSLTKEGIYCAWQLLHSETRQKRLFEIGSEPGVAWGGDYLGVVGVIKNDLYGYCFKGDPRVTTELFWPKAGFFWKFNVLQYVCVCAQNSFSARYVKYGYFTTHSIGNNLKLSIVPHQNNPAKVATWESRLR